MIWLNKKDLINTLFIFGVITTSFVEKEKNGIDVIDRKIENMEVKLML